MNAVSRILKRLRERARADEGFTLIELIIIVAVIGIITAIAVPTYGTIQANARATAVEEAAARAVTAGTAQIAQNGTLAKTQDEMTNDEIAVTLTQSGPTVCAEASWKDASANVPVAKRGDCSGAGPVTPGGPEVTPGGTTCTTDSATTKIAFQVTITYEVCVTVPAGVREGSVLAFRYTITNSGEATVTDITPSQSIGSSIEVAWPQDEVGVLNPGEGATGTAEHYVTADDLKSSGVTNVFVISGTSPDGPLTKTTPTAIRF